MSKVSPLGPYIFPKTDIIATTNYSKGVFGPGHGSVFNVAGTDNYYLAFLEFGRGSTNRQTYVNQLKFANDGTIMPMELNLDGVGALAEIKKRKQLQIRNIYASSTTRPQNIKPMKDTLLVREEYFTPNFAIDGANGSRWMATNEDRDRWIIADLGKTVSVRQSNIYFVRPTAGHAYILETSLDGKSWQKHGGHSQIEMQSPHVDPLNIKCRYLRIKILDGVPGIWEWNLYGGNKE